VKDNNKFRNIKGVSEKLLERKHGGLVQLNNISEEKCEDECKGSRELINKHSQA
jgi:hypothetical protein